MSLYLYLCLLGPWGQAPQPLQAPQEFLQVGEILEGLEWLVEGWSTQAFTNNKGS